MSWKKKTLTIAGTLKHIIRYHADRVIMSKNKCLRNSSPLNLGYCYYVGNTAHIMLRVSEPEASSGVTFV